MTDRDALAALIEKRTGLSPIMCQRTADAIVAAGWRPPTSSGVGRTDTDDSTADPRATPTDQR